MQPLQSPVTPQMLKQIDQYLAQEPKLREELAKAKAIGVDVSAQEEKLNKTLEQMRKIKEVYGKG